jgi:TonB family protein
MKFSRGPLSAALLYLTLFGIYSFFLASSVKAQVSDADPALLPAPPFVLSDEARTAGIDGTITVNFSIDRSGTVKQVYIIAGPAWPCGSSPGKAVERVRKMAKENILASIYSPMIKDGKARGADLQLTFAIGNAYKDALKEDEALKSGVKPRLVEAGTVNGRAISLPRPAYPGSAVSQRIAGPVQVKVLIDESGKVILAGPTSGHPALQEAARDAACEARFSPTSIKGVPVRVSGLITYIFAP